MLYENTATRMEGIIIVRNTHNTTEDEHTAGSAARQKDHVSASIPLRRCARLEHFSRLGACPMAMLPHFHSPLLI